MISTAARQTGFFLLQAAEQYDLRPLTRFCRVMTDYLPCAYHSIDLYDCRVCCRLLNSTRSGVQNIAGSVLSNLNKASLPPGRPGDHCMLIYGYCGAPLLWFTFSIRYTSFACRHQFSRRCCSLFSSSSLIQFIAVQFLVESLPFRRFHRCGFGHNAACRFLSHASGWAGSSFSARRCGSSESAL